MPTKRQLQDFHRRLHRWYQAHGRTGLPWRHTADPYSIYVSEIMLQQTQVKTVLERYYFPFLRRFPTLSALARAERRDVLRAWQGLGYYNRAVHMHEAARRCKGELPDAVDALIRLPGIGRNTAHAIAAFAYRQPVAVMEANVKRVLTRVFALKNPNEKELWEKAQLLIDARSPFDYNQAMMDVGSLLCSKKIPRCGECPAQRICRGKTSPQSYPVAKAKKAMPVRKKHIVVLHRDGRYFSQPRTTRFLNGLYHFSESAKAPNREAKKLGQVRQQYSHFSLEADVYLLKAPSRHGKHWHTMAQIKKLPMSMAEQKILKLLHAAH